jgi:Glycine zipper 2TM domain
MQSADSSIPMTGREARTGRLARAATLRRAARITAAVLALSSLCACETAPPARPMPPPAPPINTTVYAYPMHGQTAAQLDRDRYECYLWAKQQTGFDPSSPNLPIEARVRVVQGPPPGAGTAIGAVTGAIIGAAISDPWHRGFGAVAGALVGGAIGSTADAANAEQEQAQARYSRAQLARIELQAADYRRALSACLQGRGYSVR